MKAVEVENVSKFYPLGDSQFARFRHLVAPGTNRFENGLWALRDVNFSVNRGEAFGIIGANGSGKSTLLQVIAGILRPTSGSVKVEGRLSALLELGSGFSPQFSGRDNVYLNASLLGLSREEIDSRFEEIEQFAGIGAFIDQPIHTYSTGMVLRLAFAVAAHVDPEIVIVDEALAVGDIAFRQRCMRKIHDLRAQGVTILFVSHEASDVKALCERCLWLQNGIVQDLGEADDVVAKYLSATLEREISHARSEVSAAGAPPPQPASETAETFETAFQGHRYGDGRATILGGALSDSSGRSTGVMVPLAATTLRVSFRVHAAIEPAIAGFVLRNPRGETIFGLNTARENYPLPRLSEGKTHTVDFHWTSPPLAPGSYQISIGIAEGDLNEFRMCDYVEDAIEVRMASRNTSGAAKSASGYFQLRCELVTIHRHGPSR